MTLKNDVSHRERQMAEKLLSVVQQVRKTNLNGAPAGYVRSAAGRFVVASEQIDGFEVSETLKSLLE
jgi:hypothetical protein